MGAWEFVVFFIFASMTLMEGFKKTFRTFGLRLHSSPTLDADTKQQILSLAPKVPPSAWRFPPKWPFPPDFTEIVDTEGEIDTYSSLSKESFDIHLNRFIGEKNRVLEISCGGQYLLSDNRITPVGRIDLEKVDADTILESIASKTFDTVVVSGGIESLKNPKEFYQEIWRILNPQGSCLSCFSGERRTTPLKALKMWTTMTLEQKLWIAGSYFYYSAPVGWEGLEAYDLLATTGSAGMVFNADLAKQQNSSAFVVQTTKVAFPNPQDSNFSAAEYIKARCLGLKNLEAEDCRFVSLRLGAEWNRSTSEEERTVLLESDIKLRQIYAILKEVKEIVLPAPVKAMLAAFLFGGWTNSPEQVTALKQGVGLLPKDEQFWPALAAATGGLSPRERLALLADVVVANDPIKLQAFPSVVEQVTKVLQANFPDADSVDVVSVSVDLAISDFLKNDLQGVAALSTIQRVVAFASQLSKENFALLVTESRIPPPK